MTVERKLLALTVLGCVVLSCVVVLVSHIEEEPTVLEGGDTTILTPLFNDPEAAVDANPHLAPDLAARAVFQHIDGTRDDLLRLKGESKQTILV